MAQVIDTACLKTFGKLYPMDPLYHKFAIFKKDLVAEVEAGLLRWEAQMRRDIEENIRAEVKKKKARRVYLDGRPYTDVIGQEL